MTEIDLLKEILAELRENNAMARTIIERTKLQWESANAQYAKEKEQRDLVAEFEAWKVNRATDRAIEKLCGMAVTEKATP